jgi:hypothetical protein
MVERMIKIELPPQILVIWQVDKIIGSTRRLGKHRDFPRMAMGKHPLQHFDGHFHEGQRAGHGDPEGDGSQKVNEAGPTTASDFRH